MKTNFSHANRQSAGLSIIEITLVISLMLGLTAMLTFSISGMGNWKKGREAGENLKMVYMAQKGYLADHPTEQAASFTSSKLIPYLPGRPGAMPTAESLEGDELTLSFTVMPPSFKSGTSIYDPSGQGDDGLWDTAGL